MERQYDIPAGDGLRRLIRNAREEAIYQVLGGINAAAAKLGVRRQSVHYVLTQPRIRDVDTAKRLSEATGKAGRLVPAAEILDLAPWMGPERNGTNPSRETGRLGKANGQSGAMESARSVQPEAADLGEVASAPAGERPDDASPSNRSSIRMHGAHAA